MEKILVALSGGVDSAVAALLLKEQGYAVSGAYIRTWMNEEMPLADCPAQQDIEDSRAVARHLGIDYEIVNLVNEYREHVVNYLVDGYQRGITPNPDMMCNREMKFGIFQDYALKADFDGIATGHYVRKLTNDDGSDDLLEGLDPNKDQTYFLALLRQEQIRQACFPVGELQKPRVREIAQGAKLPNADKKDSQGICFLGDMNISRFLEYYIEDKPGDIVNTDGKVLGRHRGLHRYTTGQRRGIGVPSNTDNEFYVVTKLDMERNELVVAFDHPDSPGLFTSEVELYGLSFVNRPVTEPCRLLAKPRYRDPSQAITYTPLEGGRARVQFDAPQRALSAGQILALYDGQKLLGGGFYA
ncbi:MAG: tRNA 2-thiouridine(34) synthase MnmA [Verrucomicrobia bacterium]|jgi:tRNA-specific 2-thiouridylase|nr:tRNA 2-thiouridine(34) synthase MnmA [Verrucomicrobiota bacterium]